MLNIYLAPGLMQSVRGTVENKIYNFLTPRSLWLIGGTINMWLNIYHCEKPRTGGLALFWGEGSGKALRDI